VPRRDQGDDRSDDNGVPTASVKSSVLLGQWVALEQSVANNIL